MHPRIAVQLNHFLDGKRPLPDWMTFGKTIQYQKDPAKGSAVDNYSSISCLPLIWKLMTVMLAKKMYSYLERKNVLPSEEKECHKGSRGTKDQLLIDKTLLRNYKRRHTNLAMSWIDYYRKAYDMFCIANNIQDFLNSMKSWKLELNTSGKTLGEFDIRRGIFQGNNLSSLLFFLCMVPLTWLLRKAKAGYEWGNKGFKLNNLLFMNDLTLFTKSKNQTHPLVQTVRIFSEDIGMQFGLKKCGVLIMERRKVVKTDGIRLPDGQHMEYIDQTFYTYLQYWKLIRSKR